jgi:hypothetical protein
LALKIAAWIVADLSPVLPAFSGKYWRLSAPLHRPSFRLLQVSPFRRDPGHALWRLKWFLENCYFYELSPQRADPHFADFSDQRK